jgi:hypothetical protein
MLQRIKERNKEGGNMSLVFADYDGSVWNIT